MKFGFAVSMLIIASVVFVSCIPKPDGTSKQQTSNRAERTNSRVAETDKSKENTQNNTANKNRRSREETRNGASTAKEIPQYSERTKNARGNTAANPFERKRNALKNITNENERFNIDTTYYLLTMEDGNTLKTNDVNLAAGGVPASVHEYRDNLVLSFIDNIEKAEKSDLFDCVIFKAFAAQFTFSDSLRQEADFQYAECCIGNNNLDEAFFVLETLSKEKLNRGVAPKVLVRLGQLCCVFGDTQQADKYFKRLKREHPRSIYTRIADCSRL